jgi:hypothetical protein
MPRMSRRRGLSGVAAAVLLLTAAAPLRAQDEPGGPPAWPKVFSRAAFSGAGDFLKGAEPQRPLDITLRGDVDLVDAGKVRIPFDFTFAAAFDDRLYPQHVDYSFDFAPAVRVRAAEIAVLYHHTSRHPHDALRPQPVAWNQAGVRLTSAARRHRWQLRGTADTTWYLDWSRGYVDYKWDLVGAGRASYDLSRRTAYYVDGMVRILRCHPEIAGRSGAVGARMEGGVNLGFGAGRVDAFAGWDRRIDPTPFARRVADFFVFGARIPVSR